MASSGRDDEEKIRYDVNGEPESRNGHSHHNDNITGTSQTSSQLVGGTNTTESPSDVNLIPVIEFAVNFNDHDDLRKLNEALTRRGVKMLSSNLDDKTIHVQFADYRNASNANEQQQPQQPRVTLDVESLHRYVEQETGFLAVIKGMGDLSAAVAELRPPPSSDRSMFGVVRMSQMTNGACFVDGLIDESNARVHLNPIPQQAPTPLPRADDRDHRLRLAIHEFGDLSSDNYDSIGEPDLEIAQKQCDHRNLSSSISVQRVVPQCDVSQLIGKSVALSLLKKDTREQPAIQILSAGVIARASTIGVNKKQVCACSGKTLWEERAERQSDL